MPGRLTAQRGPADNLLDMSRTLSALILGLLLALAVPAGARAGTPAPGAPGPSGPPAPAGLVPEALPGAAAPAGCRPWGGVGASEGALRGARTGAEVPDPAPDGGDPIKALLEREPDRRLVSVPAGDADGPRWKLVVPADPRALWVVRDGLLDPGEIRRMVADAAGAGITDLFVQVRGRGDAYYESDLVPPGKALVDAWRRHGHYDPLALVLELAHARGIRVHAWMNVYLVSSDGDPPAGHVVREHPEWVAVDRRGTAMTAMSRRALKSDWTEGVYLEPGSSGVVDRFVSVVEELLARYPVDGVHLDYVRYPAMDVGYSEGMRAGFRRRTGVDPLELAGNEVGLRRAHGDDGYETLRREWRAFKAAQVTALVASVREASRRMRPELMLSAAVKPDPDQALDQVGQDWVRWVETGLVDVVAPMMYSKSGSVVRRQAEALAARVPPDRVWPGIAVYNQSLSAAAEKIRSCRDAGLRGVSIYSYNSMPGGGAGLERLSRVR